MLKLLEKSFDRYIENVQTPYFEAKVNFQVLCKLNINLHAKGRKFKIAYCLRQEVDLRGVRNVHGVTAPILATVKFGGD